MPPHPSATRARVLAHRTLDSFRTGQTPPPRAARRLGHPLGCAESLGRHLGAHGEVTVAQLLAALPADWTAFHALPLGPDGAAIDHLVVGPGGIFSITTAHHCRARIRVSHRTVRVGGRRTGYLPAAVRDAARVTFVLRERMPLLAPVQPVIALVDADRITGRGTPQQVKVLDARALQRWLVQLQPVLSDDEIAEAVVILDSPAAWRCPPTMIPVPPVRNRDAVPGARIRRVVGLMTSRLRAARS